MGVILDSDVLSILQRRSEPECTRLESRLNQGSDDDVFTTIVTFQEQMRGWLAVLHKARTDKRLLLAYAELQSMLRDFSQLNILPFEAKALSEFHRLRRQKIRIGTMDLRIASITLATNQHYSAGIRGTFKECRDSASRTGRDKRSLKSSGWVIPTETCARARSIVRLPPINWINSGQLADS